MPPIDVTVLHATATSDFDDVVTRVTIVLRTRYTAPQAPFLLPSATPRPPFPDKQLLALDRMLAHVQLEDVIAALNDAFSIDLGLHTVSLVTEKKVFGDADELKLFVESQDPETSVVCAVSATWLASTKVDQPLTTQAFYILMSAALHPKMLFALNNVWLSTANPVANVMTLVEADEHCPRSKLRDERYVALVESVKAIAAERVHKLRTSTAQ